MSAEGPRGRRLRPGPREVGVCGSADLRRQILPGRGRPLPDRPLKIPRFAAVICAEQQSDGAGPVIETPS